MTAEACEYCAKDAGMYDFDRDCCLVRFIMHAPTKTLRLGYLSWWMTKFGEERTERIREMVQQAWDDKRKQALEYGKAQR